MSNPHVANLNEAIARVAATGLRPVIRKTFTAGACLYDAVHGRDENGDDKIILPLKDQGYDLSGLHAIRIECSA